MMIMNFDFNKYELDLILKALDEIIFADQEEAEHLRLKYPYSAEETIDSLEKEITAAQFLYTKISSRMKNLRGM